jgi:epoxyqueuosine reductase
MLTDDLKNYVQDPSGNIEIGIAPVDGLRPRDVTALQQLNSIMAQYTPFYAADAQVFQPGDFLDNAAAIVVIAINYYFGRINLPGAPPRGEIMNFYVVPENLTYLAAHTQRVIGFLTERGYAAMQLATGIPVKQMAARSGIGAYGKNAVIQTPNMGSWIGLTMVITDAPLEPGKPLGDPCETCNLCQKACPTGALDEPYQCDIERCLTLHMLHNKNDIPREMREKAGTCIAHCNICLDACPKNKKLKLQKEIPDPQELVYPEIAPLVNITAEQYQKFFGETFFEFMFIDKKYLQRNAAVALGNYGDPQYVSVLIEALETQSEELVRGHAAWALGRIGTQTAKSALEKFLNTDPAAAVQAEIKCALESCT